MQVSHHSRSEGLQAGDGHPVGGLHQLVVSLVREGQRQHPLLLQIRLVDPGEGGIKKINKSG